MTYVLHSDDVLRLRRRPFRVWLSGAPEGAACLVARRGDAVATGASAPRPSLLMVHDVPAPTTVRVTPPSHTGTFPRGTVLDVRLEFSRGRDVEDEEVLIRGVDVSGLPFRDLLVVTPEGGDLSLRAMEIVADVAMGELATAARSAARALVGRDRTGHPLDLRVVVDLTASMAPLIADGSVISAVDLLAGLSTVIGSDRPVEVQLTADPIVRIPDVPAARLAAATRDALRRAPLSAGFPDSLLLPADAPAALTYVVTDAVPPGVSNLAERARSSGSPYHLVVLGPDDGLRSPADLPRTVIDPAAGGASSTAAYLAQPHALGQIVASLLREGTATTLAFREWR